jgi:hypothetical protein
VVEPAVRFGHGDFVLSAEPVNLQPKTFQIKIPNYSRYYKMFVLLQSWGICSSLALITFAGPRNIEDSEDLVFIEQKLDEISARLDHFLRKSFRCLA